MDFALGSSAAWNNEEQKGYNYDSVTSHTVEAVKFKRSTVQLWMLDFEKATRIRLCRKISTRSLSSLFWEMTAIIPGGKSTQSDGKNANT